MLNFLKSISAKRPAPDGKPPVSVRERVSALRHLPAFLKLIWRTSPGLALANIALRLLRAGLPLATLYVGKLIIDAVVTLTKQPAPERVLTSVLTLVALEFGLVLLADALGRGVALLDSLLGDLFANQSSIRLMAHAAELDLDQFEDSTFYDKLERARRQGRRTRRGCGAGGAAVGEDRRTGPAGRRGAERWQCRSRHLRPRTAGAKHALGATQS